MYVMLRAYPNQVSQGYLLVQLAEPAFIESTWRGRSDQSLDSSHEEEKKCKNHHHNLLSFLRFLESVQAALILQSLFKRLPKSSCTLLAFHLRGAKYFYRR